MKITKLLSKTECPFMITKGTHPSFRCWYYLWHLWGKQKCPFAESQESVWGTAIPLRQEILPKVQANIFTIRVCSSCYDLIRTV